MQAPYSMNVHVQLVSDLRYSMFEGLKRPGTEVGLGANSINIRIYRFTRRLPDFCLASGNFWIFRKKSTLPLLGFPDPIIRGSKWPGF